MLREIVAGYKLLMCPRYRTATPPSPSLPAPLLWLIWLALLAF